MRPEFQSADTAPRPNNSNALPDPYFEFKQVSISFGSHQVLDRVTFTVRRGETVCILGRSGAGKSVSLRLIMGFLKPDSGRVITAGEDITGYSEQELQRVHRKVTMVFQSGALFDSLTVAENVAFPLTERGVPEEEISPIVDRILYTLGLSKLRHSFPAEISTGFRRAVAIARALASQPNAVLYDEPTTMVDPLMARRLINAIAQVNLQQRLTSIVVTHDLKVVDNLADRIVFVDSGKVVFFGTREEMEHSSVQLVQEFIRLDRFDFRALKELIESPPRLAG